MLKIAEYAEKVQFIERQAILDQQGYEKVILEKL